MNAERRRALEKELQDILKITNPLVPATLDPNSPTAMSVPKSNRRNWTGCGNEEMISSRCLTMTVPKRT